MKADEWSSASFFAVINGMAEIVERDEDFVNVMLLKSSTLWIMNEMEFRELSHN